MPGLYRSDRAWTISLYLYRAGTLEDYEWNNDRGIKIMSLNISLGVSTWLWTSPFGTETTALFAKIKEMGYDEVEIPVEDPSLIDAKKVKEALDEYGLKPIICGAFGTSRDFTHEDPAFHKNSFDYIESCFEITAALGAKFVAGPMYSAV